MDRYSIDVAAGRIPDRARISKFGRNGGASANDDVWEGGGPYTGQPTGSPETVDLVSTATKDAGGETGLRSVRLFGLLTSTAATETTEDITLSGTTPVTSTNSWHRIYRVKGLAYGSDGVNAGTVSVSHSTTTSNVFAKVQIGFGQTQVACWTVPQGSVAYITGLYVTAAKSAGVAISAQISVRVREENMGGYNAIRTYSVTNVLSPPLDFPIELPPGADVKVAVDAVSTTNIEITAEMDILIEDRGYGYFKT